MDNLSTSAQTVKALLETCGGTMNKWDIVHMLYTWTVHDILRAIDELINFGIVEAVNKFYIKLR